jgi:hypothetical protein
MIAFWGVNEPELVEWEWESAAIILSEAKYLRIERLAISS